MTTLDTLARSAVAAIDESVADVRIPVVPGAGAASAGAAGWVGALTTAKYALAGAAAAVAVLFALIVAAPHDDVTDTPTTTIPPSTTVAEITTTLPDLEPAPEQGPVEPAPVVPVPGADDPAEEVPAVPSDPPKDTSPPALAVTSPADGAHVETALVTFVGTTEPGATVVASGKFPASVGSDGSWSVGLVLAPGANGVRFVATDAAGNTAEVRMTVHLDAPKGDAGGDATTTTTKAPAWEFSAFQTYGSCSEPLPYDVFYGTAKPGSTVTVASPHGSGSTTVDAEGAWSLRVDFPSAPYGASFEVKVRDEFGSKKVFSFVSLYEG